MLHGLYKNLNTLLRQCDVSWDSSDIDVNVIKLACDILNNYHKQQDSKKILSPAHLQQQLQQQMQIEQFDKEFDRLILLLLNILNNIINHADHARQFCIRNLKYNELIFLLSRKCPLIKECLLLLINNSFAKCDRELQLRLCDIMYQTSVKQLLSNLTMGLQFEHNLFGNLALLQKNTLNIKCLQLMADYNNKDKCDELLRSICDTAFKSDMFNDEM